MMIVDIYEKLQKKLQNNLYRRVRIGQPGFSTMLLETIGGLQVMNHDDRDDSDDDEDSDFDGDKDGIRRMALSRKPHCELRLLSDGSR